MGNFFSDTWKDLTQPGWRAADKAEEMSQQAQAYQQSAEDFKQKQAKDLENLGLGFLFGKQAKAPVGATGAYATTGADENNPLFQTAMTGALPRAEALSSEYFDYLRNAPDLTYNAERGALEKGLTQARNKAYSTASRRGGFGAGNLDAILSRMMVDRAGGLSKLAGARQARKGESLAAQNQLAQSLLDRALSIYTGAKGTQANWQTQVPGMISSAARNVAATGGQQGILQQLIGAYVKGQLTGGSGAGGSLFAPDEALPDWALASYPAGF